MFPFKYFISYQKVTTLKMIEQTTHSEYPMPLHENEQNAETEQQHGVQKYQYTPKGNSVPAHTVFFYNISYYLSPEKFREFAEKYGEVAAIYDRHDKGYYFVTYYDIRSAKRAVDEAPYQEISSRPVKANYAYKSDNPKRDPLQSCATVIFRSPTPDQELDSTVILKPFEKFGEIRQIKKEDDNYVIKYFDLRSAKKAVESDEPIIIANEQIKVEYKPGEDDGQVVDKPAWSERKRNYYHNNNNRNYQNRPYQNRNQRYQHNQYPGQQPYGVPTPGPYNYQYLYPPYGAQPPYGYQAPPYGYQQPPPGPYGAPGPYGGPDPRYQDFRQSSMPSHPPPPPMQSRPQPPQTPPPQPQISQQTPPPPPQVQQPEQKAPEQGSNQSNEGGQSLSKLAALLESA